MRQRKTIETSVQICGGQDGPVMVWRVGIMTEERGMHRCPTNTAAPGN